MNPIKKSFILFIICIAHFAITTLPSHAHGIPYNNHNPLSHKITLPVPIDPNFNKDLLKDVEKIVIVSRTSLNLILLNASFINPDELFIHEKVNEHVKMNLTHLPLPVQTHNESGLKIFPLNEHKILFVILDINFEKIESAPSEEIKIGAITINFWRSPTTNDPAFSGYYSKAKSSSTFLFADSQHSFDQALDRSITHISYWLTPLPPKTTPTPKD